MREALPNSFRSKSRLLWTRVLVSAPLVRDVIEAWNLVVGKCELLKVRGGGGPPPQIAHCLYNGYGRIVCHKW